MREKNAMCWGPGVRRREGKRWLNLRRCWSPVSCENFGPWNLDNLGDPLSEKEFEKIPSTNCHGEEHMPEQGFLCLPCWVAEKHDVIFGAQTLVFRFGL